MYDYDLVCSVILNKGHLLASSPQGSHLGKMATMSQRVTVLIPTSNMFLNVSLSMSNVTLSKICERLGWCQF